MMDAPFLTGQFLLAMPGIGDPRFARAVIAMCSHDESGALGVGVGAHLPGVGLHALLRQLDIEPGVAPDVPVHAGGPVEPSRGFVIHSADWGGEGSVDVAGRWVLTATLDVLRAIAAGSGPTRWLVALGYAGWGAGQLDGEMTRNGWIGVEGGTDLLYDAPVATRWTEAYAQAGIDVRLLSAEAGHA
jgi:putative transcriptional regulator